MNDLSSNQNVILPTDVPAPQGHNEVLPPWTMTAEAWWIFPIAPLPWQDKQLPKGAIDPLEKGKYQELQATYTGGLGMVHLIRYRSSPIGPYDELIYVPGSMSYKVGKPTISGMTITRIYVSTSASVVNGRRNWNTPKHLARFEFRQEDESDPLSPSVVSVYPSISDASTTEFAPNPVFRARLVPSRYIPGVPLNLSLIPSAIFDLRLFQPPLTQGEPGTSIVGTEKWCTVAPLFKGQVKVMYPQPGLGAWLGDGVGFPDVQPMSVGLWWPAARVSGPQAMVLDVCVTEDQKSK